MILSLILGMVGTGAFMCLIYGYAIFLRNRGARVQPFLIAILYGFLFDFLKAILEVYRIISNQVVSALICAIILFCAYFVWRRFINQSTQVTEVVSRSWVIDIAALLILGYFIEWLVVMIVLSMFSG